MVLMCLDHVCWAHGLIVMCSYVDAYNYHCHHTYKTYHENSTLNDTPCPNQNGHSFAMKIKIEAQHLCITKMQKLTLCTKHKKLKYNVKCVRISNNQK